MVYYERFYLNHISAMSTFFERQQRKELQRSSAQSLQDQYRKKMMLWGLAAIIASLALFVGYRQFMKGRPTPPATDPLAVTDSDWKRGAIAPELYLIAYEDLQCPACKAYEPVVKRILETFPTQLGLVFRHYPLTRTHPNAFAAAAAAQAAGEQGKFFDLTDLLYEHQSDWAPLPNPEGKFEEYAKQLNLNIDEWNTARNSSRVKDVIKAQQKVGDTLGVQGTPTFFLNGKKLENPQSIEEFRAIVQQALDKLPPPESSDDHAGEFHGHANFLVTLGGKTFDFSKPQYQSPEGKELNEFVHLHNNRGAVVHLHKENVTWQEFFKSLGMELKDTCFNVSAKEQYCNSGAKKLSLTLNGTALTQWENMPITDLDRLLINYGPQSSAQLQETFKKVADDACIFSEKCPERGKPPEDEPCVGGLGTTCD